MKNIIFWAGLFIVTFWDEILLASVKPEKTKRQQQFFETGETAQYFIGAVEDELVTLLKKLFSVKMIPKNNPVYKLDSYKKNGTLVYEIDGGVKNGRMTLMFDTKNNYNSDTYYYLYIANGYEDSYEDYEGKLFFVNNAADGYIVQKEEALFQIWELYLMQWRKTELYDKVENFEQIEQIANSGNYELALILLSGVPNIKKILA
jgi:hypothetical protein